MAVRPTMFPIIQKVRELIGDPVTGSETFNPQTVQDALDESRYDIRYELLQAAPTITNDGTTGSAAYVWIDYYSQFQYWEIDYVTQQRDYTAINKVSFEFINGHWQFSYLPTPRQLPPISASPGQFPPVFVTGKSYDIYAAAVKLLRMKIASLALTTYNFSANSQSFQRGTIITTLQALIREYQGMQRTKAVRVGRDDGVGERHSRAPVHVLGTNLEDLP